jgi:hypothetical protein
MTGAGQTSSVGYACLIWGCNARRTGGDEVRRAVIWQRGRISLIITLAAKPTAATATSMLTTAAAAAKSGALWPSLVHREGAPFQGLSVESLDRALHILFIGKLDEAEPSGFARHLVSDDGCGSDLKPSIRHELAEHNVCHTAGKVPHE